MSLRIVPRAGHATTFTTIPAASHSAFSVPGLADPLRRTTLSPTTAEDAPLSSHPLEARLKAWTMTQETLRMETLRRTLGIAEPVRRAMEMRIVRAGEWRPAVLGGSDGVGMDILRGLDSGALLDWEDVFCGRDGLAEPESFHAEMERTLGLNW
ncbi:MAG: hypothetical protein M1826_000390 [Phylliscum demangeonii]|nr:MAG: hypothetical protein M1826_000390 [Phylliscum demangeonii]